MPFSLAEYADSLEQRNLIWPRVSAAVSVAANPSIRPIPGLRAVLWDVYGTLLRVTDGRYGIVPAEELRLQIALDKTIHEFNMWNHMYRKPGPPWQSMIGIYRSTIERLQMRASARGDITEVSVVEVWRQLIEKLFEKAYVIDEGLYGDVDEFAEKVAYFFHCCLQGLEAREGAVHVMTELSGREIRQGCLSDGPEFGLFLRFMREHPNVWSKVSCPERLSVSGPPALDGERQAYQDVVPFARQVVAEFEDRVLWGTDWPHPNLKDHMPDDGLLVDYIPQIATTPELQQRLLVDNPSRLYWPEGE